MTKDAIRSLYAEHLVLLLPRHMHEGVRAYIEHGRETGGFLTALFEGDYERAKAVADFQNAAHWENWMDFVREFMPADACGSPLKVQAWRKMGGLDGYPDGGNG